MLCSAHHRALHRGSLVIEGRSAKALLFRPRMGRLSVVRCRLARRARIGKPLLRCVGLGLEKATSRRRSLS
jgi:hypothetical protein